MEIEADAELHPPHFAKPNDLAESGDRRVAGAVGAALRGVGRVRIRPVQQIGGLGQQLQPVAAAVPAMQRERVVKGVIASRDQAGTLDVRV